MDSSCSDVWKLLHAAFGLVLRDSAQTFFEFHTDGEYSFGVHANISGRVFVSIRILAMKTRRFSTLREHFAIFQAARSAPLLFPAGTVTPSNRQSFEADLNFMFRVFVVNPPSASHVLAILKPRQRSVAPVEQQMLLARSTKELCWRFMLVLV